MSLAYPSARMEGQDGGCDCHPEDDMTTTEITLSTKYQHGSPEQRVWRHVSFDTVTDCWLWTGATQRGYGVFNLGARGIGFVRAHRYVYELLRGRIADGLVLDHLCRNSGCVNPWHLEAVTQRTNILRGDGLIADQARRTQCPQGHPYDEQNTRLFRGARRCRACDRIRQATKRGATRA